MLQKDSSLRDEFRSDPISAIEKVDFKNPLDYDIWIYRMIVASISSVLILIIIGTITLFIIGIFNENKDVPAIFTALSSAAIGALAGLLSPVPRNQK